MRRIPYKNRKANAGTTYIDVRKNDYRDIKDNLEAISKLPPDPFIDKNDTTLPRQGARNNGKPNSIRTIADGILDNFRTGQYTLSKPQIPLIEKSFEKIHNQVPEWDEVVFEEVASLPLGHEPIYEDKVVSTIGSLFGSDL